ncbi:MAG: GNAT family N-acetyltransferase [Halanaerobiales bacterium]
MSKDITIKKMKEKDIDIVHNIFSKYNINKSIDYLIKCLEENKAGKRVTLLAFYKGQFAGALHLIEESYYPYFKKNSIPEVNDFNVIPPLRQKGVGNSLMEAIEEIAFDRFGIVGIGVGLYESYGSAQRLYAKRGYIPDGRGVMYKGEKVSKGSQVIVDDKLALYYIKVK